jgi:hypothetical protein
MPPGGRRRSPLPAEAKTTAHELRLADNQAALLKAAKSEDPVASLQQHGKRRRHTPEELSQRRTKTAEAEKVPARASDTQDALNRVATMLIDALGDRIAELVSVLETVTATALAKALRARRPGLFGHGDHEELPEPSLRSALLAEDGNVRASPETGLAEPSSPKTFGTFARGDCGPQAQTSDDERPTSEQPAETAAERESSGKSAEDLLVVFGTLRPNTQTRARWWIERGCPAPDTEDGVLNTEALSKFRIAAREAGSKERQRFLELLVVDEPLGVQIKPVSQAA